MRYSPAFVRSLGLFGVLVIGLTAFAQQPQPPKDDSLKTLTVEVLDKETGKPIPFIPLAVQLDTGPIRTTTDDNGKAMINLLAEQKYVSVTAKPEGYVPLQVSWRNYDTKDPIPETYTLKMEKGTTIGGIIQDEAGKPIAGATVSLLINRKGDRNNARERVTIWDQKVTTDENGRWQYDYAPKEMEEPSFRLSHPDFLSDEMYGSTPKPPLAKLRDMTGVMMMKKGVSVSGRVLDFEGQPIAAAEVAQGADRFGSSYPRTRTDPSGVFQFAHVRPNTQLVLTVRANGYSPDLKAIPIAKDPIEVEFKLEPGRVIRGRVVDDQGKPIPKAMIAADTWRGFRSLMWRGETDADGRFVWNEAPPDEVLADFLKQGYMDVRRKPIKPSDQEIVVTLRSPMKITGTVVDEETGKPVESFTVLRGTGRGENQPVYWDRRNAGPPARRPGGKFEYSINYPQTGYAVRIEAEGYLPAESKTFGDDQPTVNLEFKLKKAQMITGAVKTPDGKPVAGAEVVLCIGQQGAYIRNGELAQHSDSPTYKTDAAGVYKIPPQVGKFALLVLHDSGYVLVDGAQIAKSADITLQPWGKVSGIARIGSKPAAGKMISVNMHGTGRSDEARVYHQLDTAADNDGKFTFNRVPPGQASVALQVPLSERSTGYTQSQTVNIEPGKTIDVTLGGLGRPVIGRVAIPDKIKDKVNWQFANTSLRTHVKPVRPKLPENFAQLDQAAQQKFWEEWNKSPEAQASRKANEQTRYFAVKIENDNSFRVDDVPAGSYILQVTAMEPPANERMWSNESMAEGSLEFNIPEMPGGRSDEPLDVGTLQLKAIAKLNVGDQAPGFEIKTLEGKPLKLSDFKGKTVLVDFWAPHYSTSPPHLPQMKATFDAYGKDGRLVMITLGMDPTSEITSQFARTTDLGWTHTWIGPPDKTDLPAQWGVRRFPSNYLVGPDGKILAKSIRPEQLKTEVGKALGNP